jgi:hypothetical protein
MIKKTDFVWLVLPIVALLCFAAWRSRTDSGDAKRREGPFRLVLESIAVKPMTDTSPGYDVEVPVVIGYAGPRPKWWKSPHVAGDIPKLKIIDSYLVDDAGRRYTEQKLGQQARAICSVSLNYDAVRDRYVYTYNVWTRFVPQAVGRLTFKSKLIHPSGTNEVSAVVRDLK